jgi:4-hydroxy-4-methyl-2-oxoglutarate aldolase
MKPTVLGLLAAATALSQTAPPAGLRANRDTYHPVIQILKEQRNEVTDAQLDQLGKLALESIWGALRSLGYTNCYHAGLQSTRPKERLVGRAVTIRYLPKRPDLEQAMRQLAKEGDWPVAYNVRAAEEVKPGDVIVVDLGGELTTGVFFGDISALGAQVNGARGAVLWGSTRDRRELEEMPGFPVLALGFDPNVATQQGVDWNVPIRVGSATVLPGDIVVADNEAVLFVPAALAAQVIERATRQDAQEDYERDLVRQQKYRFRDVYPLSPELRKKYEAEKKAK